MLDDILLGGNPKKKRRKKRLRRIFTIIFLSALVSLVILLFADTGDKIILALAQKNLREDYKLSLETERITGNPIKGYELENFSLSKENGQEILRGENLFCHLDFRELFKGNLRLSEFYARDLKFYTANIHKMAADFRKHTVNFDASINATPITGNLDITAGVLNRAAINFGQGKILATGEFLPTDFHISGENLSFQELGAAFPELKNFHGTLNFNALMSGNIDAPKITGNFNYAGTKIYGLPVERLSANVKYFDEKLSLNDIQASALNVPIQGEIEIAKIFDDTPAIKIKLDGTEANIFGLDKTLGFSWLKNLTGKISSFTANFAGRIGEIYGLAEVKAPRIFQDGKTFTNINAQIKISGEDNANIDGEFSFLGGEGFLYGRAEKIFTVPELYINGEILSVDFDRIAYMLKNKIEDKEKVSVSFSVKGNLNAPEISCEVK